LNVTAHYRASNIFAVQEWAFAWIKERGAVLYDLPPEEWPEQAQRIRDLGGWCETWIENDPRDNGGDGTWRRKYGKAEWPKIYTDFKELSAT
jgi:hypothetical protein